MDHIHTFLTTQGYGEPPHISDQLNAGATSETTRTLKTIHIVHSQIHSNKTNMRRMIIMAKLYSGDLVGLRLPDISHRKLVRTGDRTRARCMTDAHTTACSTEVDQLTSLFTYLFIYLFIRTLQILKKSLNDSVLAFLIIYVVYVKFRCFI